MPPFKAYLQGRFEIATALGCVVGYCENGFQLWFTDFDVPANPAVNNQFVGVSLTAFIVTEKSNVDNANLAFKSESLEFQNVVITRIGTVAGQPLR